MKAGPVLLGLASAVLFGLATPASKVLLAQFTPTQLAGLLYLGASLGVLPSALRAPWRAPVIASSRNLGFLAAATLFGGVLGPLLLLIGLAASGAGSVSLILNLELAATAILGVTLFKEHLPWTGRIAVLGIVAA